GLRVDGLTPLRTLPADGCTRPPQYRYHEGGGGSAVGWHVRGDDQRRPPCRRGCRPGVYEHGADRRLFPADEDHWAADPADLPLASASDHRPCEALCAGGAAGAGG